MEEVATLVDLNQDTYRQDQANAKPTNGERVRELKQTLNRDPELCSKLVRVARPAEVCS